MDVNRDVTLVYLLTHDSTASCCLTDRMNSLALDAKRSRMVDTRLLNARLESERYARGPGVKAPGSRALHTSRTLSAPCSNCLPRHQRSTCSSVRFSFSSTKVPDFSTCLYWAVLRAPHCVAHCRVCSPPHAIGLVAVLMFYLESRPPEQFVQP